MAYTPDDATNAALEKSRRMAKTGERLTSAEQALLTAHSKRMVEDMSPRVGTGGPYDYNNGTTSGGYGYGMDQPYSNVKDTTGMSQLNPNELASSYQNFVETEKMRRAQGLPTRPLPAQFAQIARTNNPLGYNLSDQTSFQSPVSGSQGAKNLQTAGIMSKDGIVHSQPIIDGPYGYGGPNGTPDGTPTPQANPGIATPTANPTPVATNPAATLPFNPTDALPSAPVTVKSPSGGLALGNTTAGVDEGKLLAEAELQKQLRQQTFEQQTSGRKAMLDELSGVLQKQQAGMMGDQMPGIYEDLNTRGLLRSSALGEKVGLEQSKLARQTSEQLALQGITDRNTAINDLGSIEDSYLGARGSAMQRRFSLEDFDRQVAAGEKLGANALPNVPQSSGKASGALQGGLGGASIGATVGGAPGAAIGGTIGLIGGGKLGGKS